MPGSLSLYCHRTWRVYQSLGRGGNFDVTDLSGVDHKIRRAERQIADLKESIGEGMSTDLQRFVFEHDPQTGKRPLKVYGVPVIQPEWRVLIGEILYNLRSALDHLAYQLVILGNGQPNDNTYFPVRETPFTNKGVLRGAELCPPVNHPQVADLIEMCQPYRGVDGSPHPFNLSPLWRLHRLNIIDKHRVLLVVAAVLAWDQMWWGWNDSWGSSPKITVNTAPLKDGSPVAWFDFHGLEPPNDFDPHPSLQITFCEAEMPDLIGHPVTNVLETLCGWVEHTIVDWRFRPLFP